MMFPVVARWTAQTSQRHLFNKVCGVLVLIGLVGGIATPAWANPQSIKINQVKAAFVFNIAKFVIWPSEVYEARSGRLMICFYREDFLGRGFESIDGKTIQGRRVEKSTIDGMANGVACDIVLVPASQLLNYDEDESQSQARPVLTIADLTNSNSTGNSHKGIIMNLVRQEASIGFEVNLKQVQQRGLEMSSELLKLARIINSEN